MTKPMNRRVATVLVGGIAAAALLAACGPGVPESVQYAEPIASAGASGEPANVTVDVGCEPYADYMGHEGTSVSLFTSVLPPEQQSYEDAWAPFEQCTGIDIVYEGSDMFESQLPTRLAGGSAPDLAWIAQPALLQSLVEIGGPVPAPQPVIDKVDEYWNPTWKEYGSVNGTLYGAPNSANLKSLVWYSPTLFLDKGYAVPTTWDELLALSDQMVKDQIKPWCGGIESGASTGWPATDWLEQVVLRQSGGDVYDRWVSGEIKFDSPEITKAMDTLAGWMKNPDYVNAGFGDVKTIATTAFQDPGKSILDGKCGMLQQGSSYETQWVTFKEDVYLAEDGDVFAFFLPAMDDAVATNPVVGGGDFTVAFSDRPEVQAVQTYLASAEYATSRSAQPGSWVSANNAVPSELYFDPIAALSARNLTDPASVFRFDASALMPAAVGEGAEWQELTAWFAEDKPTREVLQAIDAAWPATS
jgi:alpha-glucoside transport system substrate-binding protein